MKFKDYSPRLKLRLIQNYLVLSTTAFIMPFLSIYLVRNFGAEIAGIILFSYVFFAVLSLILSGYLSDTLGRKKIMVIAEVIRSGALIVVTLTNSPRLDLPIIAIFMFLLLRITTGLYFPASEAMIIDITKPEERKYVYTFVHWSANSSVAIGGFIGGLLFEQYLFYLLLIVTGFSILSNVLMFFIKDSYKPTNNQTVPEKPTNVLVKVFRSYKEVLHDRLFLLFVLGFILVVSMELHFNYYIAIRISELNDLNLLNLDVTGTELYGYLVAESALLVVFLSLIAGNIAAKFFQGKELFVALTLNVLGYGLLSYATDAWILLGLMALVVIGEIFYAPIVMDFFSHMPVESKRSSYQAFFDLAMQSGILIASIFVILAGWFSSVTLSLMLTGVGVTGILIFAKIYPDLKARKDKAIADHEEKEQAETTPQHT